MSTYFKGKPVKAAYIGGEKISTLFHAKKKILDFSPRTIDAIYVEPHLNLTTGLSVSWHDSGYSQPDRNTLQYRLYDQAAEWTNVEGIEKTFPGLQGLVKIHNAKLTGLNPGTIYEIRPANTADGKTWKIKTASNSQNLKIAVASDIQSSDAFAEGSRHRKVSAGIIAEEPDLLLMLGDFTGGDGIVNAGFSAFYQNLSLELSNDFVRSDGTLIPVVAAAGNHDCFGDGAGGGYLGGGDCPYLPKLFSTLWEVDAQTPAGKGWGYISIGTKLLIVFLDTNHADYLGEQLEWFTETLASKASSYDHVLIAGHICPVVTNTDHAPATTLALRSQFLAVAQQYPNCKIYAAAHEHKQLAGKPLKFNSDGTRYEDADGIVILGAGGWGNPAASTHSGMVSWCDFLVSRDLIVGSPTNQIEPVNAVTDEASQGFWLLNYETAANVVITNLNINGQPYYTNNIVTGNW